MKEAVKIILAISAALSFIAAAAAIMYKFVGRTAIEDRYDGEVLFIG